MSPSNFANFTQLHHTSASTLHQIPPATPVNFLVKSSQLHFGNDDAAGLFNKLGIFNVLSIVSRASPLHNSKSYQNPII